MATEKQFLTRLQEIKQRDVEVLLKKAYRGIWETAAYSVNTGISSNNTDTLPILIWDSKV